MLKVQIKEKECALWADTIEWMPKPEVAVNVEALVRKK